MPPSIKPIPHSLPHSGPHEMAAINVLPPGMAKASDDLYDMLYDFCDRIEDTKLGCTACNIINASLHQHDETTPPRELVRVCEGMMTMLGRSVPSAILRDCPAWSDSVAAFRALESFA